MLIFQAGNSDRQSVFLRKTYSELESFIRFELGFWKRRSVRTRDNLEPLPAMLRNARQAGLNL